MKLYWANWALRTFLFIVLLSSVSESHMYPQLLNSCLILLAYSLKGPATGTTMTCLEHDRFMALWNTSKFLATFGSIFLTCLRQSLKETQEIEISNGFLSYQKDGTANQAHPAAIVFCSVLVCSQKVTVGFQFLVNFLKILTSSNRYEKEYLTGWKKNSGIYSMTP